MKSLKSKTILTLKFKERKTMSKKLGKYVTALNYF